MKEPWKQLHILFQYRALGTYSFKEYKTWLKPRLKKGPRQAASYVIAKIPGFLANLIVLLGCYMTGQQKRLSFTSLKDSPFYYQRFLSRRKGNYQ
jgi:hypothetical protein